MNYHKEIKKTIPFTIATKRIKYLGINLPKEAKEAYAENYKILIKEIKDNTPIYHCSKKNKIPRNFILFVEIGRAHV